jgi:hypothetical protein
MVPILFLPTFIVPFCVFHFLPRSVVKITEGHDKIRLSLGRVSFLLALIN